MRNKWEWFTKRTFQHVGHRRSNEYSSSFSWNIIQLYCWALRVFFSDPGPVQYVLGKLVDHDPWDVSILIPNLAWMPDRHSSLQPRITGLKKSSCLSFPSSCLWVCTSIPSEIFLFKSIADVSWRRLMFAESVTMSPGGCILVLSCLPSNVPNVLLFVFQKTKLSNITTKLFLLSFLPLDKS